ncbi:putative aldehyde dehydrogenase [Clavispora lusitaniae]|uniref:Aldehyde dehydrogenase n=1 Tax=Clavispora lusitaniae TaxID=36911 RepID=A0ACD0WPE1_CLALS|nr:putative aldehyde dehydrogenase [Clavispora lusitaniae]QFZ34666.1 putative aldehyde dehydrogenase [Clavispora lusitaniae]QFZ40351.1 putative aldehyde dehydrogenase [Clavispora lusitaniae]QFZ46031.1 putative aldehyde dehydrogenase [Clavispora lusitaniae]QFZ51693.1 putative aldehyde dehydrogenase [Clavispora lusitaniae]
MIAIDLNFADFQWQYHISTTFFVCVIVPSVYYVYEKYITGRPNKYNKLEAPKKLVYSIPDEAKPHWKGKRLYPPNIGLRVNGEPQKIQSYCPATGQFLGTFPCISTDEMDHQIKAASDAQKEWKKSSFVLRKQLLKTINQFILDNQEDIARVACRDSGKTKLDASMGEIMVTLEKISWIISHGEKALRPSARPGPSSLLMGLMKNAEVRYEPLGVVAAIVSWNYPLHNLIGPVVAALFSGNAIVVKCSEQVVWSSTWFVGMIHAALRSLSISEDLVQLCYCFPENADYFTSHPGLKHITFIGSKPVAHKVLQSASKELTPCVIELGGKDSVIVMDDVADLKALSSVILRGTFQSAGQNCIGIERVICLPEAYDKLVEILNERIKSFRLGSDIDQLDEIDMGAMISDNRFDQFEEMIQDAVSKGARLLHGGKRYSHPNYPQGHYFEPTLLVDVDPTMKIAQNEVFGPILTIMKAKDINDAVEISNGTEYGLGNSVFGNDFAKCDEIAGRLESGNVAINDFATFYVCQLPFGGCKKSGYGKFGGEEGLTGLCNAKSVVMDKPLLRAFGVKTSIPPPIDYPIADDKKAWGFVNALNIASYDSRIWEVLKAFKKMAKGGA